MWHRLIEWKKLYANDIRFGSMVNFLYYYILSESDFLKEI